MTKSEPTADPQSADVPPSAGADFDFMVIGSGFAGSLIACILQAQGRRVAIVDRSSHPRFAIGESSTPAAGLILSRLADQYDLPWLKPFAKYGTWQHAYPQISTGRKRGFSYFRHEPGQSFQPRSDHANEILAAASSSDDLSDTQWFRSDVDAFFFKQACEAGVIPFEDSEITILQRSCSGWSVTINKSGLADVSHSTNKQNSQPATTTPVLSAGFLIDASGAGQVLARHLHIGDDTDQLETCSRAIFTHVADLPEWSKTLERTSPGSTADHPFHSDHAAQHHILEEGWMWWLRFDSNITSVGLVINDRASEHPRSLRNVTDNEATSTTSTNPPTSLSAHDEFFRIINRYPSLLEAVSSASLIAPPGTLIRTDRLQRLSNTIAGPGWAMLPHTAGFIDPLHGTGIAHSLAGVERLANILLARDITRASAINASLQRYGLIIRDELTLIDQLVAGCYEAISQRSFRKFAAFTMCYFAAATTWERRCLANPNNQHAAHTPDPNAYRPALLCADSPEFRTAVRHLRSRLLHETEETFEILCRKALAPFNQAGLFESPIPNMYGATAIPERDEHRTPNIQH